MKQTNIKYLVAVAIVFVNSVAFATTPTTQPTVQDLQAAMDTKQYPAAIKLANALLTDDQTTGETSRFQITMLKAEAQIDIGAISAALSTFRSAQSQTTNPHEIALARWTAELFKQARGTKYTPQHAFAGMPEPRPLDLKIPQQRSKAFAALFNDESFALSPKLDAALASRDMTQICVALQQAANLAQLDIIVNGNDDKTAELDEPLLEHFRDLISQSLQAMNSRTHQIADHAATGDIANMSTCTYTLGYTKQFGLSDQNKEELRSYIRNCATIKSATQSLMPLDKNYSLSTAQNYPSADKSSSLSPSYARTTTTQPAPAETVLSAVDDWPTILDQTDRIASHATHVLNTHYYMLQAPIQAGQPPFFFKITLGEKPLPLCDAAGNPISPPP